MPRKTRTVTSSRHIITKYLFQLVKKNVDKPACKILTKSLVHSQPLMISCIVISDGFYILQWLTRIILLYNFLYPQVRIDMYFLNLF